MDKNDAHPASLVELANIKGKGTAIGHNDGNATPGPSSLPRGRKLPNLAPKPAITTSESPPFGDKDFLRKRSRMDDNPQSSSQLFQPTHPMTETMSLMNGTGSHIDNNFLEFNRPVGGSSVQDMAMDAQLSVNRTYVLETPLDYLSGMQNQLRMERQSPIRFPNAFTPQPPPVMPQMSPLCSDAGSALKICAACDARLMVLRYRIRATPDDTLAMQLLEAYLDVRDNWHCCPEGLGGLDC